MQLKIVHVVESFSGGVYDFLVDLIAGLQDHRHIIIHGRRENTPSNIQEDFSRATAFHFWPSAQREINAFADLKALLEIIVILRRIGPFDVLHLHSSKAGFLGRLAARIIGKHRQSVYTSHGVSFLRQDVSGLKKRLFIELERMGARFGGTVVACSASEQEQFLRNGIKATYINNGVDVNNILPRLGKRPQGRKIIIGTSGRISYPKNPALFNRIALEFQDYGNVGFVWIGDGELRNQVNAPNIQVTGWITKPEVFKYLGGIDIYLSTSLWEGLPLAGLQAMVAGLPLILTDCVGNRDLITVGHNGYLYRDFREAVGYLHVLIKDEKLRLDLGASSLQRSQEFTIERTIRKYERQYTTVC